AGCGKQEAPVQGAARQTADHTTARSMTGSDAASVGRKTFVIVPEQSKASYVADEEFFAGALKKLAIRAGKIQTIGSHKPIEGRFEIDPTKATAPLGQNRFTVRMNTFTTNQPRRDKWIREEGPKFNDYPIATFKATGIESEPVNRPSYRPGDEFTLKLSGD